MIKIPCATLFEYGKFLVLSNFSQKLTVCLCMSTSVCFVAIHHHIKFWVFPSVDGNTECTKLQFLPQSLTWTCKALNSPVLTFLHVTSSPCISMYNFPLALKHLFPTIKQKPLRTVLCFLCNTHIPIQLFVPNAPQ